MPETLQMVKICWYLLREDDKTLGGDGDTIHECTQYMSAMSYDTIRIIQSDPRGQDYTYEADLTSRIKQFVEYLQLLAAHKSFDLNQK